MSDRSASAITGSSPYVSYAYAYPHKSAYRPFDPPLSLREVWRDEARDALFLYVHVPFCEMRCGFCNLFTQSHSRAGLEISIEDAYLTALERQASAAQEAVPGARFTRMAIGGGTPTFLSAARLQRLFELCRRYFDVYPGALDVSVETSPYTCDAERLAVLADNGVTRVSIGVQSFFESETAAAGRAQRRVEVEAALDRLRRPDFRFAALNIDLIYGLPGQTVASWLESLKLALRWRPEELYLYPLYVRPLTGLARRAGVDSACDEFRLSCYRTAREHLLSAGYAQISMRMFRLDRPDGSARGDEYCCQEDGMLGIGCGARSYTRRVHYSTEFAVGAQGIGEILQSYLSCPAERFAFADYGFQLDDEEQRRRYVIKSILRAQGLDLAAYRRFFSSDPRDDVRALVELEAHGFLTQSGGKLLPTALGLEWSDSIGPALASDQVSRQSSEFALR